MKPPSELIQLAHVLGDPPNDLCIEAEGNVSADAGDGTLWIKGSGKAMRQIDADGFAHVHQEPVLRVLYGTADLSESDVRAALNAALVDPAAKTLPSTETYMHAGLIQMTGCTYIAHSHPTPLLSILALPEARQLAERRLFPDEIVLCGPATCFVPYVAPGLPLARAIVASVKEFNERYRILPKTLWLENHGLIVLACSGREAASTSLMAVKAARVLLGALQTGRELKWLTDEEVAQIHHWPDEHYRQSQLWG